MKIGQVTFKDFMAFCPQKLASIPYSFGFADKILKGYYPWRYPNEDNLHESPLSGLPDPWYYGNNLFKSEKEEKEFLVWYSKNKKKEFHLKKVAMKYCKGDAEILARGIQEYVSLGLEISDNKVNPILADGCLTLAGFVGLVYRACFMPNEYSIGIIPMIGYNSDKKQSVFAAKFLDWLNHQRQQSGEPLIRHKYFGGEKKIGRQTVDGWDSNSKTAIQVHGCFFHPIVFFPPPQ